MPAQSPIAKSFRKEGYPRRVSGGDAMFWALLVILGIILITDSLAQEPSTGPESGLPEPVTTDHFNALQSHSPFLRSINLSDSILLTGIAQIKGRPVATLFDRETRVSYVVSDTPNSLGWKMVGIDDNDDLEKVAARIAMTGGEIITVRFDEGQLKPGEGKPAATAVPTTPRGPDQRSLPTDEERRKFGEWIKKRMANYTDDQKRKVGELMQEKMKANSQMSDRQKGEVFVKILDYVEANR